MSALPRERLLEMFDVRHEVSFAHGDYTKINRYFDEDANFALIEKAYQGALTALQARENDLLFNVAQTTALGQEVTSRVAALFRFEKPSSPARPFSSALSVARLSPAWRDNSVWLSLSCLRRSAIWVPMEFRSSTMPNILCSLPLLEQIA